MIVVFHADGVLTQFEGYEQLQEFDWEGYRERYGDIQRLDRLLEAEGDSANRYQVSKQADVLMLLFLLSRHELRDLLAGLGYQVSEDQLERTVDYYLARTSHGSTLSGVVNAWVLARYEPEEAWRFLQHALESDVADVQGGTTAEGIHLGRDGRHGRHRAALPDRLAAPGRGAPLRPGPAAAGQAAQLQRPLSRPPGRRRARRGPPDRRLATWTGPAHHRPGRPRERGARPWRRATSSPWCGRDRPGEGSPRDGLSGRGPDV